MTFDTTGRRIWFEPPCDRPVAESKTGWRLTKGETVTSLVSGGSAERAGVLVGDRILEINGKAVKVGDDLPMTFGLAPAGTVAKALVERKRREEDSFDELDLDAGAVGSR